MIETSTQITVIYTDHEANLSIATKTKLNTINIDKLNMKLIKTFIYLSQFAIEVQHRFDKFNIISNALSRLPMKNSFQKKRNNLNIDAKDSKSNLIYAYVTTLIKMISEFKKALIDDYVQNSA